MVTFSDGSHTKVAAVTGNGTFSADLSSLSDGVITSSLQVTDPSGNSHSATGNAVALDADSTVQPVLAVNDTADHVINAAEAKTVAFTISGLEGDETGTVTFSDGSHTKVATVTGNGTFTVDLSSLSDGTITSSLQAADPNGNSHSATGNAVALDAAAPVVTITDASEKSSSTFEWFKHRTTTTTVIKGHVSDATPGDSSKIVLSETHNGVTTILSNSITPDAHGDWTYTATSLSPNVHTFTASATDHAGNVGTSNKLLLAGDNFVFYSLSDHSPGDVFVANGLFNYMAGGGGHDT
jgi:hypothetical protein